MDKWVKTKSDEAAVAEGCFFDEGEALKALSWIERNLAVKLYAWQRDALRLYFGWRKADGSYRFQTVSIWIPKKNGKSYLISALLGYKLFELKGQNIYSVAYNAKQASIVLDQTIKLLRQSAQFGRFVKDKQRGGKINCYSSPYRREINNQFTGTTYVALADNENANDGLIGHMLVVDELHRMKNRLYDVTRGCLKNIPGALEVIISTAGSGDKTHRSYEKYSYAKAVATGEVVDISLLPVIHECTLPLDTADELYSLKALLTCNPVLVEDEARRKEAERDLQEAKRLRNDSWWRRFSLGQWVSSDGESFVPADLYRTAQIATLPEDVTSYAVYVGIDKGGTWDFTGVSLLFVGPDGTVYERHYTFAVADRLPLQSQRDDTDYKRFEQRGELIVIPADAVVDEWLANWLRDNLAGLDVRAVAADPHWASYICETLASEGLNVVHVNQAALRLLTPVIEDYAERVRQKRIKHSPNTFYDWQLAHACRITASKDTVKVVKKGSNSQGKGGSGHIDNVDAVLNALAVLRADEAKGGTRDRNDIGMILV